MPSHIGFGLRRCAATLLVVVFTGGATDMIHTRTLDLCDLPDVHDASAHRWSAEARQAAVPDEHCFLCHWTRSLGAAPGPTGQFAVETVPSSFVRPVLEPSFGPQGSSLLPTRSPPL